MLSIHSKAEIGGSTPASISIYKLYAVERKQEATCQSGIGVRRWNLEAEIGGSSPVSALSFSDVDVGNAF